MIIGREELEYSLSSLGSAPDCMPGCLNLAYSTFYSFDCVSSRTNHSAVQFTLLHVASSRSNDFYTPSLVTSLGRGVGEWGGLRAPRLRVLERERGVRAGVLRPQRGLYWPPCIGHSLDGQQEHRQSHHDRRGRPGTILTIHWMQLLVSTTYVLMPNS